MMDASFQTAGGAGFDPMAGFGGPSHNSHNGGPAATGHDVPPLGDPMELDVDFDAVSWAGDFDFSVRRLEPDLDINYCPPATGLPTDFLFAEDEGVLPTASYNGQQSHAPGSIQPAQQMPPPPLFSISPSDMGLGTSDARFLDDGTEDRGLARERLRRQLSLLSKGWAGDEIRFKNCDPSKAIVLHNLAMELGLGYNHDVRSHEVSMSRLEPLRPLSKPEPAPGRFPSTRPRSSTELDSALCLPGLPVFPPLRMPDFSPSFNDTTPPLGQATQATPAVPAAPAAQPGSVLKDQPLSRHPSRSERIQDSISKHVSTLKTSIAKGGRRGPLSENGRRDMRALEGVGGACWRCKVLRRKCDPGSPCRCCLQSVPMPHLGEDAPLWPLIGCRRGPLRVSLPTQLPCPSSSHPQKTGAGDRSLTRRCRSADVADRCLLSAESQRLADMKAVFEGASYKLSMSDPTMKICFSTFIEAGRYRDRDSLQASYTFDGKMVTYSELIAVIAWELAENQTLLPLLEIKSWEIFMGMLETASIYESEVGQTSLVILSLVCFKHCLEALRLYSANLLSSGAHQDCSDGQCQVECIRNLSSQVATYTDELSSVIFNKENMRDRRWWLSTFYSLYIQSYVRHALIAIEKQLRFRPSEDAEALTATQYLHLPAVLFTAASAKYDPLAGGRLQYALTDNSVIPETSVPEFHHSSARVACEMDKWPDLGIRTPYQFLRRLLQIGSLDFFDSGLDTPGTPGSASPLALGTPPAFLVRGRVTSPTALSPVSAQEGMLSPRPYRGHGKRDSIESYYSGQPSTIFSNQSSDSLARTMSTDMTSLYEPSVFTGVSYSDSVADLDVDMGLDDGTINPIALFSAGQPLSLPSFELPVIESSIQERGPHEGLEPAFVCNCCPRSPRRFHTAEELTRHEAEKPHPCTQCKKRFKSPTEAERHINAIHLKSDSWSCKALENALLAFQSETFNGVVWDVCGFCGVIADRSELVTHLETVHKIGECDRNKKFYRADNFRQHLKNTHVAKPGKWLKALEGVCRTTRGAGEG